VHVDKVVAVAAVDGRRVVVFPRAGRDPEDDEPVVAAVAADIEVLACVGNDQVNVKTVRMRSY